MQESWGFFFVVEESAQRWGRYKVKVTNVNMDIEKQLLTGMIVSDGFLKRIVPVYVPEFVDIEAVRLVAGWAIDYHTKYGKAPGAMIQDIFKDRARALKEADAEWISGMLAGLSGEYERLGFNEQYLFDNVIGYFRRQKLEKSARKVLELLDRDRLEDAEDIWLNSMRIEAADDLGFDPFNEEQAKRLFEADKELRVKTTLGIGSLDRMTRELKGGWFIVVMGPMKRGKTSFLAYAAIHSWLTGLNTVFISLESGDEDTARRFWMNLGSLTEEKDNLLEFPSFVDRKTGEVEYSKRRRPRVTRKAVIELARKFGGHRRKFGRLRVKTFPAFSAGVKDIESYLDRLEVYENFTPHAIVVDYLGAMTSPEHGRDHYDYIGKRLKGMAEKRKSLVFTGHQGSRKALEELTTMRGGDVPEDVRILAHVDVMYGLNQTEQEKEEGKMRVNVVAHRWKRFSPYRQALLLQQPEAGQFYLDDVSVMAPSARGKKKGKEE